jgi:hypothetical protein
LATYEESGHDFNWHIEESGNKDGRLAGNTVTGINWCVVGRKMLDLV